MINQDEMTPYTAPLQDLFHPPAPLPVGAAIRLADARRRRFEVDPHARLEAIRQACRDLKAGRLLDPVLQAECIRPWPALYRLAIERQDIDLVEIFETAAARLKRQLAGEEREVDRPFGACKSAPPQKSPTARLSIPPAPADYAGDVI